MTTLEDWPRVKRVLAGALEREGPERESFLDDACACDAELRKRIDQLLAAGDRAGTFLEAPTAVLLEPAFCEDLSGRVVDCYRLESRLGAGGTGQVYRAHDTRLDRKVALKFLSPELAADRDRVRRFHQEARAASSLNHPNIVVVHDFGELEGRPYLVTELIEGETLRHRLRRGPLPLRDVVEIGVQVAGALGGGARPRPGAPGRQARERHGASRRPCEGARLRPGQARGGGAIAGPGRRRTPNADGDGARHPALHVAGAGTRPRPRRAHRRLEPRGRAVRDGHRCPPLRRGRHRGGDGCRSDPVRVERAPPSRPSARAPPRPLQGAPHGSRAALPRRCRAVRGPQDRPSPRRGPGRMAGAESAGARGRAGPRARRAGGRPMAARQPREAAGRRAEGGGGASVRERRRRTRRSTIYAWRSPTRSPRP